MTQVFRDDGKVVPVTRVKAGPCVITQVKMNKEDGNSAVQVGFGEQKMFRMSKPRQGHLKKVIKNNIGPRYLRQMKIEDSDNLNVGDVFAVNIFQPGEKVQVTGYAKGKGFQGVVKRHRFAGSPASHGHKDQLRMPGSIGATDPARVFKGTRMAGHMGDNKVTVKNLEIVQVNPEENELLVKGALPGARGTLLMISTDEGEIEIKQEQVETKVQTEEDKQKPIEKENTAKEIDEKNNENTDEEEAVSSDQSGQVDQKESKDKQSGGQINQDKKKQSQAESMQRESGESKIDKKQESKQEVHAVEKDDDKKPSKQELKEEK